MIVRTVSGTYVEVSRAELLAHAAFVIGMTLLIGFIWVVTLTVHERFEELDLKREEWGARVRGWPQEAK